MINLDDVTALVQVDREGMLGHVAALPQQCRDAWALIGPLELPPAPPGATTPSRKCHR